MQGSCPDPGFRRGQRLRSGSARRPSRRVPYVREQGNFCQRARIPARAPDRERRSCQPPVFGNCWRFGSADFWHTTGTKCPQVTPIVTIIVTARAQQDSADRSEWALRRLCHPRRSPSALRERSWHRAAATAAGQGRELPAGTGHTQGRARCQRDRREPEPRELAYLSRRILPRRQ